MFECICIILRAQDAHKCKTNAFNDDIYNNIFHPLKKVLNFTFLFILCMLVEKDVYTVNTKHLAKCHIQCLLITMHCYSNNIHSFTLL